MHTIKPLINFFPRYESAKLIGIKELKISNNLVAPPSKFEDYKDYIYDSGNYYVYGKIIKQDLEFMIPVLSDNLLYLFGQGIKVDTGIRISSFARNSKQAFYIAESKMRIPVLFYPSSILLYDNYDVSVTKFIIPKIKTMKDVFNKLNSLGLIEIENEADFFERYKLILKILDKEANQKNNKRKDK